jgi:hypothetical protein
VIPRLCQPSLSAGLSGARCSSPHFPPSLPSLSPALPVGIALSTRRLNKPSQSRPPLGPSRQQASSASHVCVQYLNRQPSLDWVPFPFTLLPDPPFALQVKCSLPFPHKSLPFTTFSTSLLLLLLLSSLFPQASLPGLSSTRSIFQTTSIPFAPGLLVQ